MSALLDEANVDCPFCGEPITLVIDLTVDEQDYIEDCFVCCRPIRIVCRASAGELVSLQVDSSAG